MANPNLIPRFNMDYTFEDLLCGISSIFSENLKQASSNFKEAFGTNEIIFTNSGRTSIYLILRSLSLPPSSNIGVPLYSCPSVFDAIIKAGHKPCFIDIDFENFTIDTSDLKKKYENIDALIVIHTFGRPAPMDRILEILDVPVIEDCAHSLLSRYKGKITGAIGDASIFSFRSGKYISAGEGGMIVIKNNEIRDRIEDEIKNLNNYSKMSELKHAFFIYTKSFLYHSPWYGLFALKMGESLEDRFNISEKRGFETTKIRKSDLAVMAKKMREFLKKVEIQRKNSFLLLKLLEDTKLQLPYEKPKTYCNYYLFPVLFKGREERDKAHEQLKRTGVDTAKLFSKTPREAKIYYSYGGDCINTEKIADRVLTIPNYHTLPSEKIESIGKKVRDVVG